MAWEDSACWCRGAGRAIWSEFTPEGLLLLNTLLTGLCKVRYRFLSF